MKRILLTLMAFASLTIANTASAIDKTPGATYMTAGPETVIGYTYAQVAGVYGPPIKKMPSNTGANVFAFRISGGETKYDQVIFVVFAKDPAVYPSEKVVTVQYGNYLR